MPIGRSITRSYSTLRPKSAFPKSRLIPGYACEQDAGICPVDALRQSLAREAVLLHQKDALIEEQEILREEADHRLLNGLQMVVSLLSLQSRAAATSDVAQQLSIAAKRVATIERIHRRLHFNDGTQAVAFKKYLEEFCRDFSGMVAFDEGPEPVILVQSVDVSLPTATAIPLGFIVNELITNAVKYGEGQIVVGLNFDSEDYVLTVSNAGQALPNTFDPAASTGLGMKIVRSFVNQIGGQFRFGRGDNNRGAFFAVHFS